jgi:hypothetical protein
MFRVQMVVSAPVELLGTAPGEEQARRIASGAPRQLLLGVVAREDHPTWIGGVCSADYIEIPPLAVSRVLRARTSQYPLLSERTHAVLKCG